ncbi:MAG TPA: DUF6152 family protein [Steroidobacteraceae bacterium]|nr:DUF6152 family protein [Steroidobacteraceae bacterium]
MRKLLVFVLLASVGSIAQAHHSAAAFDREKPYTLTGTIKEWQWANPHIWVKVMVPDGKGGADEYDLEGPSAAGMARNGASSKSFKPGDTGKFLVAPYKDGSKRGEFLACWLADGTQLKF